MWFMGNVVTEAPELKLGRAMKWMFASPNWMVNLLWIFLCSLLGVFMIGQFVLVGYQMEIIQRRSRGGENTVVDFDPNKFADYLVRGFLPAAIYFVITLLLSAVTSVFMFGWVLLFQAFIMAHPKDFMAILMLGPMICAVVVQGAILLFVAMPLAIRTGLANDITEGLKWRWAIDMSSMMWPHVLLCLLFVMLCSLLSSLGILLCVIGIFATAAWLQLVIADFGAQLYDIYLWKGGEPVAMHEEGSRQ